MQDLNKVICTFDQQLSAADQYMARGNIGALASYDIVTNTQTITVDQTASSNGEFVATINRTKPGIYILNIDLHIDSGSTPSDRSTPFTVRIDFNLSGGGVSGNNRFSGVMNKVDSTGEYHLAMTALVTITRTDVASMRLIFTCESWKIPQGANLKLDVGGVLLGNINPVN